MKNLKYVLFIALSICFLLLPITSNQIVFASSIQNVNYENKIEQELSSFLNNTSRHSRFVGSKEEYNSAKYRIVAKQ